MARNTLGDSQQEQRPCTNLESLKERSLRTGICLGFTLQGNKNFVKSWILDETTLKRVSEVVADNLKYDSMDSWLIVCNGQAAELRTRTLHGKDIQDIREGSTKHHKLMFPRVWEHVTPEET